VGARHAAPYQHPTSGAAAEVVRALERSREATQRDKRGPTDPCGRCAAVILGGGVANPTTYPLSKFRAKPAVPLGANYRLIDVPISNCINSGLNNIYVLTQFNSMSLNRHIAQAYPIREQSKLRVDVLAAMQTPGHMGWTTGSADAVRQHLRELTSDALPHAQAEEFLVLAGEHLYRMDYGELLERHHASGADITISAVPVAENNPALLGIDGAGLGLLRLDGEGRVLSFVEKPSQAQIEELKGACEVTAGHAMHSPNPDKPLIANMGIYVFSRRALESLLEGRDIEGRRDSLWETSMMDFGRDVLPHAVKEGYKVYASVFNGYWRDVSTMRAFLETNLELARNPAPFSLHDRDAPMYTVSRNLPPTKLVGDCTLDQVLVGEGCFLTDSRITNSVLGSGSIIRKGCQITDTYMMGADPAEFAEVDFAGGGGSRSGVPGLAPLEDRSPIKPTQWELDNRAIGQTSVARDCSTPVGIGENSVVRKAIIDRNAHIGANVRLTNDAGVTEGMREADGLVISSGIITVLKNAVIPDGTHV
jgi:glucose-1-phosphate adenylyltransferase